MWLHEYRFFMLTGKLRSELSLLHFNMIKNSINKLGVSNKFNEPAIPILTNRNCVPHNQTHQKDLLVKN